MINVFEALKSEGLIIQDPNDPSGSTWIMNQDADKVVEKIEKLVDYAWKTGRRYQLMELTTNKKLRKKKDSGGFKQAEDIRVAGYNQAITRRTMNSLNRGKIIFSPKKKTKGVRGWIARQLVNLANWVRPGNEEALAYYTGIMKEEYKRGEKQNEK